MDVVRERKRRVPKGLYLWLGGLTFVILVSWAMWSLFHGPGGTFVDPGSIVTDIAKRGALVRSISAHGAFQPEHTRVASSTQDGVVDEIDVKVGSLVAPGSVIARMTNPALEAAAASARSALRVAQANLEDVRQQVKGAIVAQDSNLSDARAQMQASDLQAESYAQLHQRGLIANLTYQQALIDSHKSENQVRSSETQLQVASADASAKIAAAQAQVDQASAQLSADAAEIAALTLRSSSAGIVQSVSIDPGTSVARNTEIARIADARDLKVVLQVDENGVQDVRVGMPVEIDASGGAIHGSVGAIAPAAKSGTVAVDVIFPGVVPIARPDENVDGIIELARIPDAISIARPASALDNSTVTLFKVIDGGRIAVPIVVHLGEGSADRVQVLSGVGVGDTVIVSDTSAYRDKASLRLR